MQCSWLIGLSVALLGGFPVWAFIALTTRLIRLPEKPDRESSRVPGWLTGVVERGVFFMLIALSLSGVVEAGMGWLALKLAANWQRYDIKELPSAHTRALLALLAGLISLAFAYLGGAIASGKFPVGT